MQAATRWHSYGAFNAKGNAQKTSIWVGARTLTVTPIVEYTGGVHTWTETGNGDGGRAHGSQSVTRGGGGEEVHVCRPTACRVRHADRGASKHVDSTLECRVGRGVVHPALPLAVVVLGPTSDEDEALLTPCGTPAVFDLDVGSAIQ